MLDEPTTRELELEAEIERLRTDLNFLSQRHELDIIEVEQLREALAPFARITTPKGPHVVDVDWGATLELADLERARRALEGSS